MFARRANGEKPMYLETSCSRPLDEEAAGANAPTGIEGMPSVGVSHTS
jgi:hypothetical protein